VPESLHTVRIEFKELLDEPLGNFGGRQVHLVEGAEPGLGAQTVVVIIGDGAEWIWGRANLFEHRCEILDFWHALEHAWELAGCWLGPPD